MCERSPESLLACPCTYSSGCCAAVPNPHEGTAAQVPAAPILPACLCSAPSAPPCCLRHATLQERWIQALLAFHLTLLILVVALRRVPGFHFAVFVGISEWLAG